MNSDLFSITLFSNERYLTSTLFTEIFMCIYIIFIMDNSLNFYLIIINIIHTFQQFSQLEGRQFITDIDTILVDFYIITNNMNI